MLPQQPMTNNLITLAHGGGGERTHALIRDVVLRYLGNPTLNCLDDGACIEIAESRLVMTTDSYVVDPIFFPGGDIGKLSVCGTINDLVMQGGDPRFMSLGLILEEGLRVADLEQVIASAAGVLQSTGVAVVTGDTKVVERGKGGGVFINTTGIGARREGIDVHVGNARPGDSVIVSGTIGDHGIAVMSAREGLRFESDIVSDVAPLWGMIKPLWDEGIPLRCLRDPTRGGVAAALCDIARASGAGIRVREKTLPVRRQVRGACDLLGLDPLEVANEGKAIVVCDPSSTERALAILKQSDSGRDATEVGTVVESHPGTVVMETRIGAERIVDVPSGEQLPRIC
ncbi:MAG: hydrogenase expression/formation protein HypE [Chitinivibrionales bacterium]|nr:hydrogenase expression/formation protein HypE [Chitinivibrionales bacterium]MBD3395599.1 hydrogenase expression/formation protein HypE [Chitinivibrionales bacterium]